MSNRSLDAMLTKELDRVKSEVEAQRRLIEQKDGEISHMQQQSRRIIDQKETEIAVMRSSKVSPPAEHKSSANLRAPTASSTSSVVASDGDFQVRVFILFFLPCGNFLV